MDKGLLPRKKLYGKIIKRKNLKKKVVNANSKKEKWYIKSPETKGCLRITFSGTLFINFPFDLKSA
jgi:hypothetical protein